jgi:hypothetical protein
MTIMRTLRLKGRARVADVTAATGLDEAELVRLAPGLAPYPARFARALTEIQAGDHVWFLRPIIDSYHTVWFELHEELIWLSGHTRHAEAVAGRAD